MDSSAVEDQAWLRIMEVTTLCLLPMALKAALELDVPNIIAQHCGPSGMLSPEQIAQHFPSSPTTTSHHPATSLHRILRLLASHGIFSSSFHTCPDGSSVTTYGLNPCSLLLVQQHPSQGSLAPLVLTLQDPVVVQSFFHLHEAVLDGSLPFKNAHGMPCFTYSQQDTRFDALFNRGMAGHSKLFMEALLKTYHGFENTRSLVDVGGGNGASLSMIVAQYPSIKGINFDLHHVVEATPNYPGVEHVGGDMFIEIPRADTIFMKYILHDWSDDLCLKILGNCYKALPKKGKVIVVDSILPTQVEHELPARMRYQMDLLMFSYTEGGKEHTKEELERLAKGSSFDRMQFICNLHGLSVVEFHKDIN